MFSVGKTAKLLGISIRTLHYYDEINLVKPSYIAPSGYRYYDDDAIELLQQVIFLRELEIPIKSEFATEVRTRWGDTQAYKEYKQKTAEYTDKQADDIVAGADDIFKSFAAVLDKSPEDRSVQALVARWQEYITDNYYSCTDDILLALADMYTADERFKAHIDSFGAGTAQLISDAIKYYCS